MFIPAAITMGLVGSLHCVGMCGPIALALPVANRSVSYRILAVLMYNLGRILTYSALGVFFGLVGSGFALFTTQQILSVSMGVIILLFVLIPKRYYGSNSMFSGINSLLSKVKNHMAEFLRTRSVFAMFATGMLNGLLPCGLVYMAIAGAIATGSPLEGALFMGAFGAGTIPAMFTVSIFSDMISQKFRSGINKAVPYVVSVMAIFMILRGLNLGIPYISPSYQPETKEMSCCEKQKSEAACETRSEMDSCCGEKTITQETISCCHKE